MIPSPTSGRVRGLRVRRVIAGVGAAGVFAAGVGVFAAGTSVVGAGVASATPEEDCQAVRARDHQIWLEMVAALPSGAPIPPEYVNPCIAEDPSYAPGEGGGGYQGGQPGQAGGGGGISPGSNAPTNLTNARPGGDIVPLPGGQPGQPLVVSPGLLGPESGVVPDGAGLPPNVRSPDDAGGGPLVPGVERILAPGSVDNDGGQVFAEEQGPALGEPVASLGEGGPGKLLLLLTGLAGGLAGVSRFGRGSLVGGRWTWSGTTEYVTIPWQKGDQTLFLMFDENSDRTHYFPQDVPEGGQMVVNDDGSVSILDQDGRTTARIAEPWAYDAAGRPVRTWYEVGADGTTLIQHVEPEPGNVFPILADPDTVLGPEDPGFIGPVTMDQKAAQERNAAIANNTQGRPPDSGASAHDKTSVGIVETTGRKDGETWTQTRPDGERLTHTVVPGSGGQSVDTRANRPDGSSTEVRTANDGSGGWKSWSDNSDGTASYADNDVQNNNLETSRFNESPVYKKAPVVTSKADSANSVGVVRSANPDGSKSVGEFERVSDNRVDMTVANPDGQTTEVVSTLNQHGEPNTLVQDSDGIRVLDSDGNMVELTKDLLQETANPVRTVQYDPDTGKWVPYYHRPDGGDLGDGSYWDPYRGEWLTLSPEIIQEGVDLGHLEIGDDGQLYITDDWATFLAGAIVSGGTDAAVRPLESAARASGDLRIAGLASKVGKSFGGLGYIPGIWLDYKDGRSVGYISTKTTVGVGATGLGAAAGTAAAGVALTALGVASAPAWVPIAAGVAGGIAAGGAALALFDKVFG